MRRFPALFVAVLFAVLPRPAHAAPALLDPVFGGDGIVTAFPDGAIATAVGIDTDRRIVAVGYTTGRHVDVVIARFKPDGTPDSSFGAKGHRRYDLGGADYAFAAAVIPNGGIVVVGRRSNAHDRMFVLRVRPDGTRQPSFGHHGVTFIDFGKPLQSANAVDLTRQGRIVVGGYTTNGVGARSALARLSPRGRLDKGFGGDGMVSVDIGSGAEQINDVRVLAGGAIVAAGDAENGQNPRFSVLRVGSDGKLDHSFGTGDDGSSTFDVATGPDVVNALAVAANGDYLLAGYAGAHADPAVLAVRHNGSARHELWIARTRRHQARERVRGGGGHRSAGRQGLAGREDPWEPRRPRRDPPEGRRRARHVLQRRRHPPDRRQRLHRRRRRRPPATQRQTGRRRPDVAKRPAPLPPGASPDVTAGPTEAERPMAPDLTWWCAFWHHAKHV